MPVFVLSHHDPIVLLLPLLYHKTPINALLSICFVPVIVLVLAGLYSQGMNKKLFAKFSVKDTVLKKELMRAHTMIVLLSLALLAQLIINSTVYHADDVTLSIISSLAAGLLALVVLVSLSVIVALRKGKK